MRAFARLGVIGLIAIAALAGCVRLTADTRVHADDTFSQTSIIATTAQARAQLKQLAGVDLGDLRARITASDAYTTLTREHPGHVSVDDYVDDDLSGVTITATDLPIDAFGTSLSQLTAQLPSADQARLTRTEDTYVLSLPTDGLAGVLDEAGVTPGQLGLLAGAVDVRITFTFPGLVRTATVGAVDGKSVTLALTDLASGDDITIVAGAADQTNWRPWLVWGGIGLAVLVIVSGATALIVQDVRRHRTTALPSPDAGVALEAQGPGILGTTDEAQATSDDEPT